jgi:hypothetical protein
MISARYASCWDDVRAATRRSSSACSVANNRIRVRRGLERGMCQGAFGISHYNRRASTRIPYLYQPTGRGTRARYGPVSLSIATSSDYAVPLDLQVPLIAEAGFTHFSLGANESHSNYLATDGQRHQKALAAQHGLAIDTIRGARADPADGPVPVSRAVTPRQSWECRSWSFTVVRSTSPRSSWPDRLEQLVHTCEGLVPVLPTWNVRLALENVLAGQAARGSGRST